MEQPRPLNLHVRHVAVVHLDLHLDLVPAEWIPQARRVPVGRRERPLVPGPPVVVEDELPDRAPRVGRLNPGWSCCSRCHLRRSDEHAIVIDAHRVSGESIRRRIAAARRPLGSRTARRATRTRACRPGAPRRPRAGRPGAYTRPRTPPPPAEPHETHPAPVGPFDAEHAHLGYVVEPRDFDELVIPSEVAAERSRGIRLSGRGAASTR